MRRLTMTLAATVAALAAGTGTAFAATPVQSTTQSADTGQAALAGSSATQDQPSNQNISVRILSPGSDGAVNQSNNATSSASATNTATTTQSSGQTQSLSSLCGCVLPAGVDAVADPALQTAGAGAAAPASTQAAPATPPASSQANDATSTGTAANTAPTSQTSSQGQAGSGGVQSSQQDASTDQTAVAASSAEQEHPSNSNVSVRILSPGDDGSVSQSNDATSTANATNSGTTTQGSSQSGSGGSGVQSSTQSADTTQGAIGLSSAKQDHPSNSNVSVRILSEGDAGSVSQSNDATSTGTASNTAPVTQSTTQDQSGSSCGCSGGGGPAVQAIGQSSSIDQGALAASSAFQKDPSNLNAPVRIGSDGNDGAVTQSNDATSTATGTNTAPVQQTGTQDQSGSTCGCSSDPAVQAIAQSSKIGQLAVGLSSAKQIGASNTDDPVRIWSDGDGGSVTQSNDATSTGTASNTAPTTQSATQAQDGSGVQAIGQDSSVWQAALAASEAFQLFGGGKSRCGCDGSSGGNTAGPVRVGSDGGDGALTQDNGATSHADAPNLATPTQTTTQSQSAGCGCSSVPAVQALGQQSGIDQLAAALSAAKQLGADNSSQPVRVWSAGDKLLPGAPLAA